MTSDILKRAAEAVTLPAVPFVRVARTLIPDMAAAIAERDVEIKRLTADLARSEAAKYRYKLRGDNHWETMRCIYWIATAEGDIQAIIQHIEDAGSGYMERPEETLRRYQTDLAAMTARAEAADAETLEQARLLGMGAERELALMAKADRWERMADRLADAVIGAQNIVLHCEIADGSCCCGEEMARHSNPIDCGHQLIDHGQYQADKWLEGSVDLIAAHAAMKEGR